VTNWLHLNIVDAAFLLGVPVVAFIVFNFFGD
jgi:hypothetical protein